MTFKHVKFEDSPTMRALERVAKERGLVKPESLIKKASVIKKADLTPTKDLMENILKLCSSLREQGLVKEASELETKYMQYKQAQTLYEAHKETGEDLLEQAHPEGSHKLENVDSDEAVVEDLIDKHEKIEEMVEKKPQAKLSDAASILKAVKKVLAQAYDQAQDEANLEAGRKIYTDLVTQATGVVQNILSNEDLSDWSYQYSSWGTEWSGTTPEAQTGMALKTTKGHFESLQDNLNNLVRKAPSVESVNELKKNLTAMMNLIQKASNIQGISKSKYLGWTQSIYSRCDSVLKALRGELPAAPAQKPMTEVTIQSDPIVGKGVALINKLRAYQSLRNVSKNPAALKWTNDEIAEIQDVMKRFTSVPEGQEETIRGPLATEMNEKETEVNDFYSKVQAAGGNA